MATAKMTDHAQAAGGISEPGVALATHEAALSRRFCQQKMVGVDIVNVSNDADLPSMEA